MYVPLMLVELLSSGLKRSQLHISPCLTKNITLNLLPMPEYPKTYPLQAGNIRRNGYIVIESRPCKVPHVNRADDRLIDISEDGSVVFEDNNSFLPCFPGLKKVKYFTLNSTNGMIVTFFF
ncbi:uncharacterized protein [Medicago truncatula]|uniref:uncharacterized protein isoform X1 n=1 Tax=Medicago truncatula TaxID=3880 RepID=UPI000D2F4438|nr:uncharacterized protein LOC25494285 isoform X1 [Medicago truncatula]